MTNQEASKILSDLAGYEKTMDLIENHSVSVQDALLMAIKALEQEPSEDAISREEVIDSIEFFEINPQHFSFENLIDDIKEIPSIQPKAKAGHTFNKTEEALDMAIKALQEPKIGHWITTDEWLSPCECSECKSIVAFRKTKFCPNCGARMVEPQESEE